MPRTTIKSEDIADTTVVAADLRDDSITNAKIKSDAAIAQSKLAEVTAGDLASTLDLSSKTVTLPAVSVTAHVTQFDDNQLKEEIALLGFRTAANGSLAKYNLVDQTIDAFEDASGVNSGTSTGEERNSSNYYSGNIAAATTSFTVAETTSWTSPYGATSVEYLVVGAGGGGGLDSGAGGGGGGAGGYRTAAGFSITSATSYTVTVGAGGAGGSSAAMAGVRGGDSVFSSITSNGGSGGGGQSATSSGSPFGSGGGAAGNGNTGQTSGTVGQGNDGGTGGAGSNAGGGGGGASADGANYSGGSGGAGGAGTASSITGSSVTYAGGGGSGKDSRVGGTAGAGGAGGGGAGSAGGSGTAGTANTGGGGGGTGYVASTRTGGAGGSGIVILKTDAIYNNMTLVSTTTTAQAAPTKGDIVFTYSNGAGSTTLGGGSPDVTAEYSADGGSTWTSMTLGSEGTTGSHNIATAHDVTLTSTSGTSMAYRIKTLNQSTTKTTRIQAVSLGWS